MAKKKEAIDYESLFPDREDGGDTVRMILGAQTFIRVRNALGKESSQPVEFCIALQEAGRELYNLQGEPLSISPLGVRPMIELQLTGTIPRSIRKSETHLVVGPDVMIQGIRAKDFRGSGKERSGEVLQSVREGDARVKKARGYSTRSQFEEKAYEVNATGELNGIAIDAE